MSAFFLGVDGGQSSTTALIGDASGHVVGMGRGGPCNHVGASEGRAKFMNAVGGCLREALAQAGLPETAFESVCLGFSGGAADKEALSRELIQSKHYVITHDALIALSGATGGDPGVVTIAGTGSIAFGRNAEGRTARAGGWGYAFGDEGGGFDLVRQALRAALRQDEGWGPKTILREMLLEATGARDANELLHWFYTADYPRPRVAAFSKLVDEAATSGDGVAGEILKAAAHQLATITGSVRAQIFDPESPARISYIGGVFRSGLLRERFRMLMELDHQNQVAEPLYGPAAGALIEAYRAAGHQCELQNVPKEK